MIPRLILSAVIMTALVPALPAAPESPRAPAEQSQTTRLERDLLAVFEAQETLFRMGEAGEIGEADFSRRAAAISSEYDRLLAANPDDITLLILYGKFLRRMGSDEDAHRLFVHANRIDGKLAVVKQQIGSHLAEQGQYAQALAFYLTAVQLEPQTGAYHFGVGQLLFAYREAFIEDGAFTREGLDRQMLQAFSEALRLEPDNKDFRFRLGEAYYDVEKPDWEAALALWKSFESRELTDLERDAVRLHKARVLVEMGRKDEAASLITQPVVPSLETTRARLEATVAPAQAE